MKKITFIASIIIGSMSISHGAVSISGSAINNLVPGDVGKTGIVYVDSLGTGFGSLAGPQLSIPASFIDSFQGLVTSSLFGNAFAINPSASIDLVGDVQAGDSFGILLFDTATDYRIFTNPNWILPADGGSLTLTGASTTGGDSPLASGTVVPEPSSFALLAGCFGLAWVMVRRRA